MKPPEKFQLHLGERKVASRKVTTQMVNSQSTSHSTLGQIHGNVQSLFAPNNAATALSEEVTIVTMYLDIGEFQKGEGSDIFTPTLYHRWMKIFAAIENPVVAFFDNVKDKEYFENLRRRFGPERTKAVLVRRDMLWAFSLLGDITRIFKKPGYPKHHPNTVIPEYSCAMHAKYEVMTMATKANYFRTRYFAWLDIGLFRSEASSDSLSFFSIWLPPDFNSSAVAYTEVMKRVTRYETRSIVYSNAVWVCGCFFIAEVNIMTRWSEQYMRATQLLIQNYDIMATDQQVLYILYNSGHPKVGIQTYHNTDNKYNSWFYLGYLCKEQGDKKKHGMMGTQTTTSGIINRSLDVKHEKTNILINGTHH